MNKIVSNIWLGYLGVASLVLRIVFSKEYVEFIIKGAKNTFEIKKVFKKCFNCGADNQCEICNYCNKKNIFG